MITSDKTPENSNQRDAKTRSLWQENAQRIATASSEESVTSELFDVVVVGAGITGLTTALLLQEAGLRCVITEAKNPGFGATGGTTSHINTMLDTSYDIIERDFGLDNARLVAAATMESIALIYNNVKKYKIDCDFSFRDGYLFAEDEAEAQSLKEIFAASKRVGVDVEEADHLPIPLSYQSVIVFKNQAQIDPIKYINGLFNAFIAAGGLFIANNKVEETKLEDGVHTLRCTRLNLRARKIVYATHIPPGINILHLRCAPYRSYVLAVQLEEGCPDELVYDMKDPYHYFRSHEMGGKKYLILGGEDHKTGHSEPAESFAALEQYLQKHFRVRSIDYRWSAQFYESADGLPYIGELPSADKGIYTATGFSGNGITWGSFSGLLLKDILLENDSPFSNLFAPARLKPVAGFKEFVRENADVAYRYIADRVKISKLDSVSSLASDSGTVVKYEDKKVAVYKDSGGGIHALDPVCTHAGCIVKWNGTEKSWDCPCHGGRFDIDGKVLTGPPRKDLQKLDIKE
ncbi:glycine/D-amino acid oxidase-like deaminating enzyme [Arcticibacter pallidicorallinus]|uniref:Glycine/D-amino acid oxidase-like deaminating enzyme n=1 Tax=Arcticibacter pallidicorallinus TaxID=1259464 RepID=A0A2T0U9L7_9SPHI|nr:FAD-dependent oxidoreductase [Arcticibacter pallidicorallinus]PRY54609.1 glycine/D-amino acid oxidase-like deaminating enzyme [Arcticibacter pallidicorallinus]